MWVLDNGQKETEIRQTVTLLGINNQVVTPLPK